MIVSENICGFICIIEEVSLAWGLVVRCIICKNVIVRRGVILICKYVVRARVNVGKNIIAGSRLLVVGDSIALDGFVGCYQATSGDRHCRRKSGFG